MTSRGSPRAVLSLLIAGGVGLGAPSATPAQNIAFDELQLDGMQAEKAEIEAFFELEQERFIRARELAERILARDKRSYVAHLVLGQVQHYAEANLPRSLFHLNQARALYEKRHGEEPELGMPWRWHATILRELAVTHGDMEHHADKLAYIARYNELYDPDMIAERAWPLMKLGRYTEARLAAELGLAASERPSQRVLALNALCAIEFEAGNDGASYEACERAVLDAEERTGRVSAVDLTNLAEAARSVFKLDEAERLSLQAAEAPASWYGNPWMELAELYTRQARFGEALSALKQVPAYRAQRPPHVRDADRNELRRALSSFLLVLGKASEAFELTGQAIDAPDRRAHNSRDPAQDLAVIALLDRRARRVAAQLRLERAASEPLYLWPLAQLEAAWLKLQASRSAARVQRLFDDDRRLIGTFRIGTASSAVMPPWLVGELSEVLGAGVVSAALARARARDGRSEAPGYYDAFEAEAAFTLSEHARALQHAQRALSTLPRGERLLQARTLALAADSARKLGRVAEARKHYDGAFQRDPGVFRRLEIPVAVEARATGSHGAELRKLLLRSPRFVGAEGGLQLSVQADASGARICLSGDSGQVIDCATPQAKAAEGSDTRVARFAQDTLRELFAPRIDLSQSDINSLDGTNLVTRDALESLFE